MLRVEGNTLALRGATAMRVATVIMSRWARVILSVVSLAEGITSVLVTATTAILVAVTTVRPIGAGLVSGDIGAGITAAVAAVTTVSVAVTVTVMIGIVAIEGRVAAIGSRAIGCGIVRTAALARALNARVVDKMNIL